MTQVTEDDHVPWYAWTEDLLTLDATSATWSEKPAFSKSCWITSTCEGL